MPAVLYNIKQKTQADVNGNSSGGDPYYYNSTIRYNNKTKTLLFINYDTQSIFTIGAEKNLIIVNEDKIDPSSYTSYNPNNKTLSLLDLGYSSETGGGDYDKDFKNVPIEVPQSGKTIQYPYYRFTSNQLKSTGIVKIGYCCNSNVGKDYPIFIKFAGDTSDIPKGKFYPSKEGMYEFQPESLKVTNGDIEEYEEFIPPAIEEIWVPANFSFTLDYVFTM